MIFYRKKFKKCCEILKDILPVNGDGICWMCYNGFKPDEDMMHFDQYNCWGGDQKCLWHSYYGDARKLLGIKK